MDKTKRWWLWEYIGYTGEPGCEVVDSPCTGGGVRCTEVRLVPVQTLDEAIGNDDGLVTLRVAPDSLEAAIAGTRRGERWVGSRGTVCTLARAATDSWHRVEELLRCPACGAEMHVWDSVVPKGKGVGCSCGVHGPRRDTEAEAREAWRKMGGAR